MKLRRGSGVCIDVVVASCDVVYVVGGSRVVGLGDQCGRIRLVESVKSIGVGHFALEHGGVDVVFAGEVGYRGVFVSDENGHGAVVAVRDGEVLNNGKVAESCFGSSDDVGLVENVRNGRGDVVGNELVETLESESGMGELGSVGVEVRTIVLDLVGTDRFGNGSWTARGGRLEKELERILEVDGVVVIFKGSEGDIGNRTSNIVS